MMLGKNQGKNYKSQEIKQWKMIGETIQGQ